MISRKTFLRQVGIMLAATPTLSVLDASEVVTPREINTLAELFPDVPTWTTKAGQEIPIADLEDEHLINIVRMLNRNFAVYVTAWKSDKHGAWFDRREHTVTVNYGPRFTELAETAWFDIVSEGPAYLWPEYEDLVKELHRRNLSLHRTYTE